MHTPLPSWLSKQRARDAGWIEMDWTKPVAQSTSVALIFIRWLCRRLGSTMGSAICDRCDVRSANGILFTTKDEKTAWGRERGRGARCQGRAKSKRSHMNWLTRCEKPNLVSVAFFLNRTRVGKGNTGSPNQAVLLHTHYGLHVCVCMRAKFIGCNEREIRKIRATQGREEKKKGQSELERKSSMFPASRGFHVIGAPMGPERNFDHKYFLQSIWSPNPSVWLRVRVCARAQKSRRNVM